MPAALGVRVADPQRIREAMAANGDILVRTLCLLLAFGWFANAGARFGDVTLAANHILLQLVSFSAFFLDGNAELAARIVGASAEDAAYAIWSAQIRYLGVGAMLVGGVWALISIRESLLSGIRSGLVAARAGAALTPGTVAGSPRSPPATTAKCRSAGRRESGGAARGQRR